MSQVAVTTDLRAVLASLTVKKRIKMCGSPAVPSTSANISERVSSGSLYLLPACRNFAPSGVATLRCSNIPVRLKPKREKTKIASSRVPPMSRNALTICT